MKEKDRELLKDLKMITAVIVLYLMIGWSFSSVFVSGMIAAKDLCGKREPVILVFRADMFCR